MQNVYWKVCSIFILLVLTWFGGLLPTRLRHLGASSDIALSLGNAFSGGVFLCVGVVHLLPDAIDNFKSLDVDLPIPFLIALGGFLLVFWVEKILMANNHEHEVVALSTAATASKRQVDVIYVPKQRIAHYSDMVPDEEVRRHRSEGHINFKYVEEAASQPSMDEHEEKHAILLDKARKEGHHHHIDISTGSLVPYILALVLSIHSFIEGLALGVQSDVTQTTILLIAIASHKWIEAFAFGASFVKEGVNLRRWLGILVVYSLTTPIGIAVGLSLSGYLNGQAADLTEGALEAMASGTFLYVAVLDILAEEFENPASWRKRYCLFLVVLLGIALISLVLFWNFL